MTETFYSRFVAKIRNLQHKAPGAGKKAFLNLFEDRSLIIYPKFNGHRIGKPPQGSSYDAGVPKFTKGNYTKGIV